MGKRAGRLFPIPWRKGPTEICSPTGPAVKKKPPPACPDGGLPKEEDFGPSTFYVHIINPILLPAIDECHMTCREMTYNFRRGYFFTSALRARTNSPVAYFTDFL